MGISSYFGSAIIRVTYGLEVDTEPRGMEYLTIAEELMEGFSSVFAPGKYLVEVFPILRFVPKWFPGAQFKRQAVEWKPLVNAMHEQRYMEFKDAVVSQNLCFDLPNTL